MGIFSTTKKKYAADASASLLTGVGAGRRNYIKEVLMDGINSNSATLGKYITDRLCYTGPHIDLLVYNNRVESDALYRSIVGEMYSNLKLTELVPSTTVTPLSIVQTQTGDLAIDTIIEEEIGYLDFEWRVKELVATNHNWHFSTDNWAVDLVETGETYIDTLDVIIQLFDDPEYSNWTDDEKRDYEEANGASSYHTYTISTEDVPDKYLVVYGKPSAASESTTTVDTPIRSYVPTDLDTPVDYGLDSDNTVTSSLDLNKNTKVYKEVEVSAGVYEWQLQTSTDEVDSTLTDVLTGNIVFKSTDDSSLFLPEYYTRTHTFTWETTETITESLYTQVEPGEYPPDWVEGDPEPADVTVNYRDIETLDVFHQYTTVSDDTTIVDNSVLVDKGVYIGDKSVTSGLYNEVTVTNKLYSILPIRANGTWVNQLTGSNYNYLQETSSRLLKKVIGSTLDDFTDSLIDAMDEVKKIPHAAINFAVPINTTDERAQRYLFEFFDEFSVDSSDYIAALDIYNQEMVGVKELVNRLVPNKTNFIVTFTDPVTNITYNSVSDIPLPTAPKLPTTTKLNIINSSSTFKLNRTLSWQAVKRTGAGNYDPEMRYAEVSVEMLAVNDYKLPKVDLNWNTGSASITYKNPHEKVLRLVKQYNGYHEVIDIMYMTMVSRQFRGKTVTQTLTDAFKEAEGSVILAPPLISTLFKRLDAQTRAQTASAAVMITFGIEYSYKVKTGWGNIVSGVTSMFKNSIKLITLQGGWKGVGDTLVNLTEDTALILGGALQVIDAVLVDVLTNVFGMSKGTASFWSGVIQVIAMIVITVYTGGGASAFFAGAMTAGQIALVIATISIEVLNRIVDELYKRKMDALERDAESAKNAYDKNMDRLAELEEELGLELADYDLTRMFTLDQAESTSIPSLLPTDGMMIFPESDNFLAEMETDMRTSRALEKLAVFGYVELSRNMFKDTTTNLVEHYNNPEAQV